ncbi:hypothetical protein WA026_023832 [Henosepilachna vigintioctopunctata]|uniref:MADF domain-containing protein n=1 Tax=Henosepilachna vigintioctopunctata TaxID=420089 RepID=A0AAW1TWN5_9CUCU
MEWTKCRTTKLIELFEQESVLWNVRSAHHKNSNSRVDALQRISEALGSKSDEIEKKLHNIRSQYLREKTKIEKSKKSGAGASDVYVPKWCYYSLLSFLGESTENLPHTSSLNLNLTQDDLTQERDESVPEDNDPPEDNDGAARATRSEPVIEEVKRSAQQESQEPPTRKRTISNKGSKPPAKVGGLEKKINHAYEVLTTAMTTNKGEDECFGEYVGESLKKFQDRTTKAWIRHSISNILYQAECGGAGVNMFPPWNNSQNTFYRAQPPQTFPGYNQHNYASSSSPSPYPSPQANNQQPQLSPVELQTNQTPVEDYEVLQNSFYQ